MKLSRMAELTESSVKRTWTQADQVVAKGDTYDVDIKLPASLGLIEGEGSIKGAFDYPDGYFSDSAFYCSDWFGRDDSTAFCEEGLSNVSVLLLNSNMKHIINYSKTKDYQKNRIINYNKYIVFNYDLII